MAKEAQCTGVEARKWASHNSQTQSLKKRLLHVAPLQRDHFAMLVSWEFRNLQVIGVYLFCTSPKVLICQSAPGLVEQEQS